MQKDVLENILHDNIVHVENKVILCKNDRDTINDQTTIKHPENKDNENRRVIKLY